MKKTFLILLATVQLIYSQGTGDTNVSLFGNISPSFKNEGEFMKVAMLMRYDEGKNSVTSISPMIRFDLNVNDEFDFQMFLTSKYADGVFGNGFSFGDLNFIGTYHLNYNHLIDDYDPSIDFGFLLTATGGRKIQKGVTIDNTDTYAAYPMEYQSTLGTIDIYLGYTFKRNNFNVSLGYQHPILKQNFNNFFPRYFPEFGLGNVNPAYPPSNEMNRSGDIYSRIGYNIKNAEGFFINLGLTGFYRVSNSRFFMGERKNPIYPRGFNTIPNTKGLALNAVIQSIYKINETSEVSIYAGLPIINRKETIDGLLRNYFITPGYTLYF